VVKGVGLWRASVVELEMDRGRVESVGQQGSGWRLGEEKKEPVVRGGRAPKHQDFDESAAMEPLGPLVLSVRLVGAD
jgi:hypothetical protein